MNNKLNVVIRVSTKAAHMSDVLIMYKQNIFASYQTRNETELLKSNVCVERDEWKRPWSYDMKTQINSSQTFDKQPNRLWFLKFRNRIQEISIWMRIFFIF